MCEKKISTENGVLQCELAIGHTGMHHAGHGGGRTRLTDQSKSKDGEPLFHDVEAMEIEWPQEGMNNPIQISRPSKPKTKPEASPGA